MTDVASIGANIHKTVLDVAADALGLAVLVLDKNDEIVFASRHIQQFYPVADTFLQTGTRLRDFLGAVFDCGMRAGTDPEKSRRRINREEWISEHLSLHWRERYETVERVGRHRWFSVRMRRISNGLGIFAISDISEQKKREEQVQLDIERIELTEGILDSLPNPICVKDRSLNYIAVNKAFCAIHGMPPESILGRSVWDLLEPGLAEKFEQSDRAVLETGKMFCLPEQMVRADGDDLWVVTRKFRVGEPGKYVLVTCMNDVTDVAVWSDGGESGASSGLQIRDYNAFEPAQNCYDPFRSLDMQHVVEAGAIIERSQQEPRRRMLLTTDDADFTADLLGQLRIWGVEACAVRNAAEQRAFQAAIGEAGLTIDCLLVDIEMDDSARLMARWTASPSLRVSRAWDAAQLRAEIDRACRVDPPSDMSGEPPQSADWDIVVANTPLGEKPVSDIEVLVAEDNEINQFVFTQILEGLGISYRLATNGEEAVALWHQYRPSLVLMDVSMPVMNGFDATRAIRNAEKEAGGHTPIVAVTAQALDIDIESSIAAGMDDYITKPISPDMIEVVYAKYVKTTGERIAV